MHWQLGHGHALHVIFEKIGYGILGGFLAGRVAAAVVVYAGGRRQVSEPWLQVVPLAGALLAFWLTAAIEGSGFIAAFVGGLVFGFVAVGLSVLAHGLTAAPLATRYAVWQEAETT